jgi:hypothetical protein
LRFGLFGGGLANIETGFFKLLQYVRLLCFRKRSVLKLLHSVGG